VQGQPRGRSPRAARPRRRSPRPRWPLLAAPLALVGLLVLAVAWFARAAPSGPPETLSPTPAATPAQSATSGPAANPLGTQEPTREEPGAVSADEEAEIGEGAGGSSAGVADPDAPPAGRGAEPTPSELRRVRVGNSEGQGANRRREPSAASERVKVVRDGTELDLIGVDRQAEGRTWRNVQDDTGAAGWVLSELLLEERVVGPRPTPTPAPPQIQVTEISSPVGRGEAATLTIVTRPGLRCEVRVLLFGPAVAPRRGLEPKVADERGECSWTWTVPDETVPGAWRYAVTVGTGDARVSREVTFGVT